MNICARSRKSMLEQIAAMEFAVTRLCENKGKHRKQYKLMDEELKNQFDTLKVLVSSLKDSYGDFLWRTVQEDEELGLSFVPISLRKHVPVILKSRKGELVELNR